MKFYLLASALATAATAATAFTARPAFTNVAPSPSSTLSTWVKSTQNNVKITSKSATATILYSSMGIDDETTTYGIEGPRKPRRARGAEDLVDPEKELAKYIRPPEPIPARPGLDGTVLVSGWVRSKDRTDQTVFDLLNHEDAAFHFDHIKAFVDDEAFARKRLLSRHARYTGLLDKLQFQQADSPGALPTSAQLEGVKSWVAHVECDASNPTASLEEIKSIASAASGSSVENVAVLLSNASALTDVPACVEAIKALDGMGDKVAFTVVAVGELKDTPEGSMPYEIADFGTDGGVVPAAGAMSRDEGLRLVTECLALESGKDKALTVTEVETIEDSNAARLIKGLREAGYTRPQEIHHMIIAGVANYTKAVEEYKAKIYELENPDPEKLRKEKEEADRKDAEAFKKSQEDYEERKKKEIEEIARSWAKREYFRKSMSGNMGMTEEEYIESVWERAMFEGDLKYRMMHGGKTDERKELSEFLSKQELKKQAALKRAREALEGQLGPSEKEDAPVGTVKKDDDDGSDKDEK